MLNRNGIHYNNFQATIDSLSLILLRLFVCLFVLSRRVVDGYHTIFQVGTTVQIVGGSVWVGVFIQSFRFRLLSDQTAQEN